MMDKKKEIATEVIQDMFTLYLCFKTQSKVKNIFIQELYGYVEVYFYSVFLHELIKADLAECAAVSKDVKKLLEELRLRFLKKNAFIGGHHTQKIIEEMGIDFDHYMYDLVLTTEKTDEKNLYAINFSFWDLANMDKVKVDTFNSLAQIPEKLIEESFQSLQEKELGEEVIKKIERVCAEKAFQIERFVQPVKYPYPSGILFNNPEPCEEDKILILYHYSYFALFNIIDNFIPNFRIETKAIRINISQSLMKLKAMLIEQFGSNIKNLNTPMVEEIKREIEDSIHEKDAFKVNRKLRNNIHYTEIDIISELEWEITNKLQNEYFDIVLKTFNKYLHFKFGKKYRFIRWIADHTDSKMRELKKK